MFKAGLAIYWRLHLLAGEFSASELGCVSMVAQPFLKNGPFLLRGDLPVTLSHNAGLTFSRFVQPGAARSGGLISDRLVWIAPARQWGFSGGACGIGTGDEHDGNGTFVGTAGPFLLRPGAHHARCLLFLRGWRKDSPCHCPLVKRRSQAQIAGMVAAYGNVGAWPISPHHKPAVPFWIGWNPHPVIRISGGLVAGIQQLPSSRYLGVAWAGGGLDVLLLPSHEEPKGFPSSLHEGEVISGGIDLG